MITIKKEVNDGGAKASSSPFTSEHAAVVDGVLYSVGAIGFGLWFGIVAGVVDWSKPIGCLGCVDSRCI